MSKFGAATKAKLANPAAAGQPEDQLRAPLETLILDLAEAAGRPAGSVVLVGETALADLRTRPDYSVTVGLGGAKALVGSFSSLSVQKLDLARKCARVLASWPNMVTLRNTVANGVHELPTSGRKFRTVGR